MLKEEIKPAETILHALFSQNRIEWSNKYMQWMLIFCKCFLDNRGYEQLNLVEHRLHILWNWTYTWKMFSGKSGFPYTYYVNLISLENFYRICIYLDVCFVSRLSLAAWKDGPNWSKQVIRARKHVGQNYQM